MQNCDVKCVCECRCDHELVLRVIEKVLDHKYHDLHSHDHDHCHEHCHWESGEVHLTAGRHEVFIRTKCQASHVFVCNHACHQVCGAGVDLFATQVSDKGFVLLADVKNDHVKVEWMACHKEECKDDHCEKK